MLDKSMFVLKMLSSKNKDFIIIIIIINIALVYAGWHFPELVSPRTKFCDAVHMIQEGIMGYALRKHYSCQKFVKTDGLEHTASNSYLFPTLPSPFTRHSGKMQYLHSGQRNQII